MRFSVIIPVYNVAPYLAACLDSIVTSYRQLADSEVELEIICIDDGSTDGSGELLETWAARQRPTTACQQPLTRILRQENSGLAAARNRCLEIATGDYFVFVDPDDSVTEDYFSVLVRLIRATDASFYAFGLVDVDDQRMPVRPESLAFRRYDLADAGQARDAYVRTGGVFACNACYRREFVDMRFVDITPGEDSLFVSEAFVRATSVVFAENVIYRYLQRPGSLAHRRVTSVRQVESLGVSMFGRMRLLHQWRHYPNARQAIQKTFNHTYVRIAGEYLLAVDPKDRRAARQIYFDYGVRCLDLFETLPTCLDPLYRLIFRHHLFWLWLPLLFVPWESRRVLLQVGVIRRLHRWIRRRGA